jgi:phage baseplate assembly protein W
MPYKNIEITSASPIAQQVQKQSQFFKGFSSVNNIDGGNRLYDFDLVKQDLLNHFNTKKGERLMNPTFGSAIWDLLMEPLTQDVRDLLIADINTIIEADPRITANQINLTQYDQGFILELTLALNGTDQSANLMLTFDQKIGLSAQ